MSRPVPILSGLSAFRAAALASLLWVCTGCGKDPSISLPAKHLTLTCPDGMVLIEATSFHSGPFHVPAASPAGASESRTAGIIADNGDSYPASHSTGPINPLATDIPLPAYCIDRYTTQNPQPAGEGIPPPALRLTYEKAQALCQSRHMQLCTPYQWELACRGKELHRFPYGQRYDPHCGWRSHVVSAFTGVIHCKSSYGIYDQLGRGPEWVISDVGQPRMGPPERHLMGGHLPGEDYFDVDCLALRSEQPAATAAADATPAPAVIQVGGVRCCTDPASQSEYVLDYDR